MEQPFVNAVYYPNWRVYKQLPPSSIQVRRVSHILYAFIGVKEDGTLKHFDEWADLKIDVDGVKGCLAALAKLKKENPHLKTLVSFGGGAGSAEFAALAASRKSREVFAREARLFVDRFDFDGVDIDWEHPSTTAQGRDYISLLADLRQTLPAPRFLLTSALPCGEWALKHIPAMPTARLLDYINIMSYDFAGPWTQVSGHHAQLRPPMMSTTHGCLLLSAIGGVSYLITQGVSPSKILLGVPAYARYFPGSTGPGQAYRQGEAGEMDYCDVPTNIVGSARMNADVGGAWYVDPEKGFVSLDVPATVRMKARYVQRNRLGGMFYWTGVGDVHGEMSLVRAGHEALNGGGGDWKGPC